MAVGQHRQYRQSDRRATTVYEGNEWRKKGKKRKSTGVKVNKRKNEPLDRPRKTPKNATLKEGPSSATSIVRGQGLPNACASTLGGGGRRKSAPISIKPGKKPKKDKWGAAGKRGPQAYPVQ